MCSCIGLPHFNPCHFGVVCCLCEVKRLGSIPTTFFVHANSGGGWYVHACSEGGCGKSCFWWVSVEFLLSLYTIGFVHLDWPCRVSNHTHDQRASVTCCWHSGFMHARQVRPLRTEQRGNSLPQRAGAESPVSDTRDENAKKCTDGEVLHAVHRKGIAADKMQSSQVPGYETMQRMCRKQGGADS